MTLSQELRAMKDLVQNSLPEPDENPKTFFFRFSGQFTPVTELAAILLLLYRQANDEPMPQTMFRTSFLQVITAADPGAAAARLCGLTDFDQLRINTLVGDLGPLPEAFSTLVLTEAEVHAMPPEQFIGMLYRMLLARDPDAEGLALWSGALREGTPATDIVHTFSDTDERRNKATGHSILVLTETRDDTALLTARFRQLQEAELARLYDLATLVSLLGA